MAYRCLVLATSMLALGVSARQGNDVAASLAKAEAAWKAHQPRSYEFTIALGCFCPPSTPPTFRVTDGKPEPVGDIDAQTQRRYSDYNTIEKLFAALRPVAAARPHKMIVTYDEKAGYPTAADVDPKKDALDDQFSFTVTNFKILHLAGSPQPGHAQVSRASRPIAEVAVSSGPGLVAGKSWASGVGVRVAIAPSSSRRLSLEFDASRTLSSEPLNPKTHHGSPTIASAQVSYYFSGGRVQPFLGGGIGVVWSSLRRPVVAPADERPARSTSNLGVGVRLRLTRAISVRPEFRWYAPAPLAIYRVSFALAYGW